MRVRCCRNFMSSKKTCVVVVSILAVLCYSGHSFLHDAYVVNHRTVRSSSSSDVFYSAAADDEQSTLLTLPSSTEAHALEVFNKFAEPTGGGVVSTSIDLFRILCGLDVEATQDEASVLFRYLDEDGDNQVDFEDFLPWYLDAASAATDVAEAFQSLLIGRRTIEEFDRTPVGNDVLRRAVQCALAAPNRSCSEPWRFIQVGPQTIARFAELNRYMQQSSKKTTMETEQGTSSILDWTTVPGWCVVTTKITPDNFETEQEDFKSVCCAIQNFMLSMWSEGIGTKWTSGPVQKTQAFADICQVDTSTERVVGCIWYGYAAGGAKYADPRRRKKTVTDVLSQLP
ncbi:nitroreductase family protein [Nitzschia inconspicua]|uniref:Nitroreductase family protein n=1 Tax=Nitzschia inconspicua TaxID=303405 RepID=A0A9K3KX42_9STRA|nr:nitroreductase family protein [Nitzschia inconspicua]